MRCATNVSAYSSTVASGSTGEFNDMKRIGLSEGLALRIHDFEVAFDGIDVLLGLLDNPVAERREIYRIRDWLARTGLTGILTLKVGGLEETVTVSSAAPESIACCSSAAVRKGGRRTAWSTTRRR